MRLIVVAPGGQLLLAARLAAQGGADVVCADTIADALKLLAGGCHADVVLIEAALAAEDLKRALRGPRVIACGTNADAGIARAAIAAGASEYLPLPGGVEETAALIAALARDDREIQTSSRIN